MGHSNRREFFVRFFFPDVAPTDRQRLVGLRLARPGVPPVQQQDPLTESAELL